MVFSLLLPREALTLTLTLGVLMAITQILRGVEALAETRSTLYSKRSGIRVNQEQEFLICGVHMKCYGGQRSCVIDCSSRRGCSGVNFNTANGSCMGVATSLYTFGSGGVSDSTWNNFSPVTGDVRDRESKDWILVFRAQSDMIVTDEWVEGGYSTNTYRNDALHSEDDLPAMDPACYSADHSHCTRYYRSKLLTNWPSNNIDKVRLVLYTSGRKVVEVVFNGTGSSRDNWFHTGRLISSPWSDLVPGDTNNVISIDGKNLRRFTIVQKSATNCPVPGWLIVLDNLNEECKYEADIVMPEHLVVPKFLYAPPSGKVDFFIPNSYLFAEVMAIFVKML